MANEDIESDERTFYLLVCRQCGDPERPLPIPFDSPAERGQWASGHTAATGHDCWIVKDERRQAEPEESQNDAQGQ